jgi:hypothetical protein
MGTMALASTTGITQNVFYGLAAGITSFVAVAAVERRKQSR